MAGVAIGPLLFILLFDDKGIEDSDGIWRGVKESEWEGKEIILLSLGILLVLIHIISNCTRVVQSDICVPDRLKA